MKTISAIATAAASFAVVSDVASACDGFFYSDAGIRIHYAVHGDGPPVVLIHGYSGDADLVWLRTNVVSELMDSCRVITLDCRGHGKSDKPHGDKHYGKKMVADIVSLLNALDIPCAHVVGYSSGGCIAMSAVVDHPHRFITATFVGSGGVTKYFEKYTSDWLRSMIMQLESGKSFADASREVFGERPTGEARQHAKAQDAEALLAVARGTMEWRVTTDELKGISIPLLFVFGSTDLMKPSIDPIRREAANARFVEVDGAGHVTLLTEAEYRTTLISEIKQIVRNNARE